MLSTFIAIYTCFVRLLHHKFFIVHWLALSPIHPPSRWFQIFAGRKVDHKSTSDTCPFFGNSWVFFVHLRSKFVLLYRRPKRNILSRVFVDSQFLLMKQNLVDLGLYFHNTRIFCDNTSAINISKNSVLHSQTKHIWC